MSVGNAMARAPDMLVFVDLAEILVEHHFLQTGWREGYVQMRQKQSKTARLKRNGSTKTGQKPKTHPLFHGSAVLATIKPNFGVIWGMSVQRRCHFCMVGVGLKAIWEMSAGKCQIKK